MARASARVIYPFVKVSDICSKLNCPSSCWSPSGSLILLISSCPVLLWLLIALPSTVFWTRKMAFPQGECCVQRLVNLLNKPRTRLNEEPTIFIVKLILGSLALMDPQFQNEGLFRNNTWLMEPPLQILPDTRFDELWVQLESRPIFEFFISFWWLWF